MNALTQALASAEPALFAKLEALYKDIHQHPELSMQEAAPRRSWPTRCMASATR
jgi:hippurate hydrolase